MMKKHWEVKRLGEVGETQTGTTPKTSDKENYGNYIPFITPADIDISGDGTIRYREEGLSEQGLKNGRKMKINSILMVCIGASIGKVGFVDRDVSCNQQINSLTVKKGFCPKFFYYALSTKGFFEQVIKNSAQATLPIINKGKWEKLTISYPPSEKEQQRIVASLDEAFAAIATAKETAEKNLQNSRELFESHLQSIFTKRGEGWVDRTLDQVCIVERGSSPRPIKDYFTTEPNGVNWIKIGDTEEGGKYVYSTAQKITTEGAKQSRFVKEGDFILTNSMSFGRPYIMKTSGYIHDGWFVLRLNISIDTDYFYYLLSSRFVQSQFAQLASGSVVKNISGDLVKKAVLPIPPMAHQHVIVEKLLEISAETRKLEAIYRHKLADLDELKKSVLEKAFSGDL